MIAVIDYRMGNTRSVVKTLGAIGYEAILTNDPAELRNASHLILPGVGAFKDGMANLRDLGLVDLLAELVVQKGRPLLAICLGLQLLSESSTENDGPHAGLGFVRGRVERFSVDERAYKIPHVGWNTIDIVRDAPLFENVQRPSPDFYFVHSYRLQCADNEDVLATCTYGETFTAALQHHSIYATQFHPEKSQKNGVQVLKNFCSLNT
ncbi:MAG: imidazole glycerol phosphate synthase subunit HisH [bacterium]